MIWTMLLRLDSSSSANRHPQVCNSVTLIGTCHRGTLDREDVDGVRVLCDFGKWAATETLLEYAEGCIPSRSSGTKCLRTQLKEWKSSPAGQCGITWLGAKPSTGKLSWQCLATASAYEKGLWTTSSKSTRT